MFFNLPSKVNLSRRNFLSMVDWFIFFKVLCHYWCNFNLGWVEIPFYLRYKENALKFERLMVDRVLNTPLKVCKISQKRRSFSYGRHIWNLIFFVALFEQGLMEQTHSRNIRENELLLKRVLQLNPKIRSVTLLDIQ